MKISEIKKEAAEQGIEIKKCKFTVNNQDAYRVTQKDGSWKILVKADLITTAKSGLL